MRSPLSTMRLVLQMADRDMLNPEDLAQFLTKIRENTEQVQKMMDNLLNWSISQMKLQVYEPKKIDIAEFLKEHIGLYEPLAQAKSIKINVACEDHFYALADQNQLALIFRNLVDNAIKFTPINGFIEIGLKRENNKNLFYILNSGELISESTMSRILSNDQNILVSSYGTSQEKGTGLGLQLCKEFIKNLDSKLEINHTIAHQIPCTMFYFEIHELIN
jgi:signal transduction histidine kinase